MDVRELVGRNLRRLRESKGLSREELAMRSGVNRGYITGIEAYVRNPTVVVLGKLAGALDDRPAVFLLDPGNAGG